MELASLGGVAFLFFLFFFFGGGGGGGTKGQAYNFAEKAPLSTIMFSIDKIKRNGMYSNSYIIAKRLE